MNQACPLVALAKCASALAMAFLPLNGRLTPDLEKAIVTLPNQQTSGKKTQALAKTGKVRASSVRNHL